MKKTIAKIMAAAMVLSTVVVPNAQAAYSEQHGAEYETLTVGGRDILTDSSASSYANPIESAFDYKYYTSTGYIYEVDTDVSIVARAPEWTGAGLVWYEDGEIKVDTSSAAVVTAASQTDIANIYSSATAANGSKTLAAMSDTTTVDKLASDLDITFPTNANNDTKAALIIKALTEKTDLVSLKTIDAANIANATGNKNDKTAIATSATSTTNAVKVSGDDAYKDVTIEYDDDFFDGGYTIRNGKIVLLIATPTQAKTDVIKAANNGTSAINLRLRLNFGQYARIYGTNTVIGYRSVSLRLINGKWNGYVLLKKDNATYQEIGVNFDSSDANHYATIEEADIDTLKLDTAKGGRLLLDYVYESGEEWEGTEGANNRAHASEEATSNAFKIRRIGSRVFKGGKFQQISGWGDDGAKYIRTINNGAFRNCKQLKKVNLDTEKKLRKINAKAFYDCKKLATVKMDGRNLKAIGSDAFKNCKSNINFRIKGNASQFKKAKAKIVKKAPKKAKFTKI